MKLRDYQQIAVDDIMEEVTFNEGANELILVAPTGYGKSLVIAELIKEFRNQNKTVVLMTNITKLIGQAHDLLNLLDIGHQVIKANFKAKNKKMSTKVTIAMQQTLSARTSLKPECDILIIDERHISFGSDTMNEIINRLNPSQIIGLSATPIDGKGFKLSNVKLVFSETVKSLTEKGFLSPVKTFMAKFSEKIDYSSVDIGANGDYSEVGLAELINTKDYNKMVVSSWNNMAKGKPTIVFASGVDHANSLRDEFILQGHNFKSVHSKNDKTENEDNFRNYELGKIEGLVSVSQITTGFDSPKTACGICCRPTKTLRLYRQMVGRIARIHESKTESLWLDFAQCSRELGLYDEDYNFEIEGAEELKSEKEKLKINGTELFVNSLDDDEIEVVRSEIETYLEEQKSSMGMEMVDEDIFSLYEALVDHEEIIRCGAIIYQKMTGDNVNENTIDFVIEGWTQYFVKTMRSSGGRALKTMIKNVTKKNKKFAGLKYSADWLLSQEDENSQGWNK